MKKFALAIHGGAGTILKAHMTADQERDYREALESALSAGRRILEAGGKALDAVEAAVVLLEDCPLFNAGRGSVFTNDEKQEMEASIMCGHTLEAGAVAGVRNVRNPVALARRVMDASEFVFLAGKGAIEFAHDQGLPFEPDEYFFSQFRYEQLKAAQGSDKVVLDHDGERKFGTVGAVALDQHGNLAAATSTGGLTNKRYGRLGDSSVIGSGTYANNESCAVSCTGYGEFFLRAVVAHDIACLMAYKGLGLREACHEVVKGKLVRMGGEGGSIAVDAQGNVALCFNSEGMYRGYTTSADTALRVGIYGEDI
jgi:beta-aspartyl-peptidase (threonine type)